MFCVSELRLFFKTVFTAFLAPIENSVLSTVSCANVGDFSASFNLSCLVCAFELSATEICTDEGHRGVVQAHSWRVDVGSKALTKAN